MRVAAHACWSHPVYPRVATLVGERTGLHFSAARVSDAEAGIRRAMVRAGASQLDRYLLELEMGRAELDDLIAELTVGETYFFREPLQWQVIREEILPALSRLRPPEHQLRLWSAGCASGEEAYSLAIVVEEAGLAGRAHILATDLSRDALEKARLAHYGPWSLRGSDPSLVERHFSRDGSRWRLDDRLRRQVQLEPLNLAADRYPSFANGTWRMDLILCRNVLIYLDDATVQRVYRRLADCLAPGGWLITGPSDPALDGGTSLEAVVTRAGLFYRRPAAPTLALHPPSPAPSPFHGEGEASSATPAPSPFHGEGWGEAAAPPPIADPLAAARAAFGRGDYATAVALTRDLPDPAAAVLAVRATANHRGPEPAERLVAAALTRHPASAELHVLHAVLLLDLGRPSDAAQGARRALYLDRSLAMAHFLLGTALLRLDDRSGARKAFRNARDLCAPRPPAEPVPLADGQRARGLAEAAEAQLQLLAARRAS